MKTQGARDPSAAGDRVAICIVTHNSAPDLAECFAAIQSQDHRPLEVVIVDCASTDNSAAIARGAALDGIPRQVLMLPENRGFAGGMNAAFQLTDAPYVLLLNPDAAPMPTYTGRLLARMRRTPTPAAAVTGRLVRPPEEGFGISRLQHEARLVDACGIVLTRNWRHLDRGSGDLDRGQWNIPEQVFGATGAASLFSRAALEDVKISGDVFDPAFHSYREDAELCFRFHERGWQVIYEPGAVAIHRRRVVPERRGQLPEAINYHSLKNRYLLRVYHQTASNLLRTGLQATFRDLQALVYVLLFERSSLPAYAWLWRHRREILARRRLIRSRCTAPPAAVEQWFAGTGLPL